jgi:CRP/FNR family nitrogen fixation transcriptional regulator
MIVESVSAGKGKSEKADFFSTVSGQTSVRWTGFHELDQRQLFQAGDFVHREGDDKTEVYQVEYGAIALFHEQVGDAAVALVLPGQFLGLGFLKNHAFTARAMVPSTVRVLSRETMRENIERDANLKEQDDDATEREFNARRNSLTLATPASPFRRLAGFLVALSEMNAREGRDPYIVHGPFSYHIVADYMAVDVDTLARQLIELRRRRYIDVWEPDGLVLLDLPGLESVANDSSIDARLASEASEEMGSSDSRRGPLELLTV